MKNYKSELINKILEQRGHEMPSLHYESECIETWINEVKGAYPKLTDYESEWLNYIIENPIGEFPYETIIDVTDATVDNVVPYAYKSAILKGSTKYRDVDTGDILDTFDETKNLELVSVRMPGLTTTGKNLIDNISWERGRFDNNTGLESTDNSFMRYPKFIPVKPSTTYVLTNGRSDYKAIYEYDTQKTFVGLYGNTSFQEHSIKLTTSSTTRYIRVWVRTDTISPILQLEEGSQATSYEPYKSNILTVNEDVTLRSNGNVCDELDLLTGKLTQRIDEDGSVLTQEVVKTVDLSVIDQDGNTLSRFKPLEGTMHISTDGTPLKPTVSMEIPVEAITQNLCSFIEEE